MGQQHSPKSATTSHSYKLFGIIAKVTSLAEIYKAFARRLHPVERSRSYFRRPESNFFSANDAYGASRARRREGDSTPESDKKTRRMKQDAEEEEEEFVISSPKLLSRTTSRIAPKLFKSSSGGSRGGTPIPAYLYAHVQRSASVSSTTTPPSLLSKTMSQARRKPPPLEKKLKCTLEELCYGCTKEVKITREINSNSGLILQEEEYVTIKVKPGWRRGTKITFERKGDERMGTHPEDIIFVIEEKKHPVFKREGDDLEIGVQISLAQALMGCTIEVPTLGGEEKMVVNLDNEIIYPGFEKTIPGQGMPKYKEGQAGRQRGDLRLKFLIAFPTDLSEEQRSQVASILKECF
ncbi:hypothetical protein DM860_003097 [Cuscuta australis]|uniref:Chaperone DnaJ C-terminal domain-containing protein n=1 Tax=Cuscuta australis TaxID=267555 RepID=A0A328D2C3_9ASTE|nr:hypothetical protein DM860_003097 [Cuscuta australis]